MKLKINNLKDDDKIKWKKISCQCVKGDMLNSHPFKICLHCKYEICENSMPRESFKVNKAIINKDGKQTGIIVKEIKEITIVRGSHDDIQGWTWST
jgi:hypothetical protein